MRLRVLIIPLLMASALHAAADRLETLSGSMMCMCGGKEGGCRQMLGNCEMVGCPTSGPMRRELRQYVDQGRTDQETLSLFEEKLRPSGACVTSLQHLVQHFGVGDAVRCDSCGEAQCLRVS
jgi:hypothetical protein